MFHIASTLHSPFTLYTEGVATVSVMDADSSFHTHNVSKFVCFSLPFSQNDLHAVYSTRIAPASKAVAWCLHEGTTSQSSAVNKLDSHRSSRAQTASVGENAVFTSIVFTYTAALNNISSMIKPF